MARRVNIEALVTQHGVAGLARKVGVATRTVERWRNDLTDPSPLAVEKLRTLVTTLDRHDQAPMRRPRETVPTPDIPVTPDDSVSPTEPRASGVIPARRLG